MSSRNSSTLVSIDNINAYTELLLRNVGEIKNSENVAAFKINFEQMKDGLVPVDYTATKEREVVTIDLNG